MAFTALNKVAEHSTLSGKAANRSRAAGNSEMASRYDGEAYAFAEAYTIMKAEIERLRNQFQNGALSMDDFDTRNFTPSKSEA